MPARRAGHVARDPADLVAAALGGADLVARLVVDGRAARRRPSVEPEPRAVPRALDAAVDDRALVQRAAGMGAHAVHGVDRVADPDDDEVVDARRASWSASPRGAWPRSVTLAGVELDPLRPGAAEGVAADHVAEDVDDVAADERAGGHDEEPDDRERDRRPSGRPARRTRSTSGRRSAGRAPTTMSVACSVARVSGRAVGVAVVGQAGQRPTATMNRIVADQRDVGRGRLAEQVEDDRPRAAGRSGCRSSRRGADGRASAR